MFKVQLTIHTADARKISNNSKRKPLKKAGKEMIASSSNNGVESDEYVYIEKTHCQEMVSGLAELRSHGTFCDVTICVEDEEFPCHKAILSSFSPYFKAMFTSEMAESQQKSIVLNGVDASSLRLILDYAYSGKIHISAETVQSLLSASNLLQVIPVREACCRYLDKHMTPKNCLGIHCFAEVHACDVLAKKAKEFALKHFSDVRKQPELLSLPCSKLVEFVSSDHLEAEREEDVFETALQWLDYDPQPRGEEFHLILEHVRLPLLCPYYLFDCVVPVPAVSASPECQRLVEEAKLYNLLLDRRNKISNARTRPRRSFGISEVIVAVGGEDDKVVLRSVDCFDPANDRWLTLACLPFAISKHGVVVTGENVLYVTGGEYPDGTASRSLWRYDPIFDQWHEMASMNVERSELGLAILDGFIYAIGGWDGVQRLDSVERYCPETNTWERVESMSIPLTSPAVVGFDGKLYVTGGAVLEDGDGIDVVQRFCPLMNEWVECHPMLIARSGSRACVLGDKIYVVGGWHASTENTNKVEFYDPVTDTWQFCKPMLERRYQPGVAVVDGRIYVAGGEEGWDRYHNTVEYYDPETDTWLMAGVMQSSRSWLCCATLRLHVDLRTSSS